MSGQVLNPDQQQMMEHMMDFLRKWFPEPRKIDACPAGYRVVRNLNSSMLLTEEELLTDLWGPHPWITLISGTEDHGKPERLYLSLRGCCAITLRLPYLINGSEVKNDQLILLQSMISPVHRQCFRDVIRWSAIRAWKEGRRRVHLETMNTAIRNLCDCTGAHFTG